MLSTRGQKIKVSLPDVESVPVVLVGSLNPDPSGRALGFVALEFVVDDVGSENFKPADESSGSPEVLAVVLEDTTSVITTQTITKLNSRV